MSTSIHTTRQARRVHLSHLATTHRAPLVPRRGETAEAAGGRRYAFTPMAREPLSAPSLQPRGHDEA